MTANTLSTESTNTDDQNPKYILISEIYNYYSGLRHQLDNIGGVIAGSTRTIKVCIDKQMLTGELNPELMQMAEKHVRNILSTLEDLKSQLETFKKDTGILANEKEAVKLKSFIEDELLDHKKHLSEDIDIRIEDNYQKNVLIHKGYLKFVLENLILNSVQHAFSDVAIKRKKKIRIKIAKSEKGVDIIFVDNGSGIHQNQLDFIMNEFYTSKPSTNSGVGLALCKKYVENILGGTIRCSSVFGEGTTFSLSLPEK